MLDQTAIRQYLEAIDIPIRLSCITDSDWPAVLSLWFLLEDDYLYCATPKKALVVRYLAARPRCGFEIASDRPPYCGIRGIALAEIDDVRGIEILGRLCDRYLGGRDNPLAQKLLGRKGPEVAIRLIPQRIHRWDFTERMAASLPETILKPCPS